jgi:hypothetical protein
MAAGKFPKDIQYIFKTVFKNTTIRTVKPGSRQMKLGLPVMFVYDAKHKDDLPYWDSLPFSIVLAKYSDRFLGINLHYLPWTTRLQLGKMLVRKTKNKNRFTYGDIKKAWTTLKLPEALLYLCIRTYLHSHIKSPVKQFDWETYNDALKNIRPEFHKGSEKRILAAVRAKWALHKKKAKARRSRPKLRKNIRRGK